MASIVNTRTQACKIPITGYVMVGSRNHHSPEGLGAKPIIIIPTPFMALHYVVDRLVRQAIQPPQAIQFGSAVKVSDPVVGQGGTLHWCSNLVIRLKDFSNSSYASYLYVNEKHVIEECVSPLHVYLLTLLARWMCVGCVWCIIL